MPTADPTTQQPQPHRNGVTRGSTSDAPRKEDILDDIRIGLRQAMAGEGRPARLVLDEIRQELAGDADRR